MTDTIGWAWMIGFTLLFGAFLGFVLTFGELLGALAGAVILTLVGVAYLLTIGKNEVDLGESDERGTSGESNDPAA